MKSIRRLSIVVLALAIIGGLPALQIRAQGTTCFDLPDADCKILSTASANIGKLTSFQYVVQVALKYDGPDQSGDALYKGNGVLAFDPQDMQAKGNSPEALNSLKVRLSLDSSLRDPVSDTNSQSTFNLVIVDGVMYTQAEDGTWKGVNIMDSAAYARSPGGPLSTAGNDASAIVALMRDPQILRTIAAIPKIKGFITLKRTKSAPVLDGQTQIEFVYTYNIQTLVTAKELYPLIRAAYKASGVSASMSDARLAQLTQSIAKGLKGTTLMTTLWVRAIA